jgi:hypothetical protein
MVIDIVCDAGSTWIVVIGRNPHSVEWKDSRGCATRGLKHKITELISAARQQVTPIRLLLSFLRAPPEHISDRICDKFNGERIFTEYNADDRDQFDDDDDDDEDEDEDEEFESIGLPQMECTVEEIEDYKHIAFFQIGSSNNSNSSNTTTTALNGSSTTHDTASIENQRQQECSTQYNGKDLINLDTTALLAIITDVSYGAAEQALTITYAL